MGSKGWTPVTCDGATAGASPAPAPVTTPCCPNECPDGEHGEALYESFYCDGAGRAMLCKKDNIGGPRCGVCDVAFSIDGDCIHAYWVTEGTNYSKKFCETPNGRVIDA